MNPSDRKASGRPSGWWWLGGAALAILVFVRITRELLEGEVDGFDKSILLAMEGVRTPWLTIAALDVTALGSVTLVTLFSAFMLLVLLALRDRYGAAQLLAASVGAAFLTTFAKDLVERIRPAEAQRLIVVEGFSYPSGHSLATSALYLTMAIVAGRSMRHQGARAAIIVAVSAVLGLVGTSRLYLGVHYATDVVSGIALGAAWAFLLGGIFEWLLQRAAGRDENLPHR